MHCLPAFHDIHPDVGQEIYQQQVLTAMEVTDDLFRSRHSVVFTQAENRLHIPGAIEF